MSAVFDASVALKWYVWEPDTAQARAAYREADRCIAPDIVIAEVCNAAWRRARIGHIARNHAERIAAVIAARFDELVPSAVLAARATAIANAIDTPVYDCLYIALAERTSMTMITADSKLVDRLRGTVWQRRALLLSAASSRL
jgi:predicted nucleic acid-binding protein